MLQGRIKNKDIKYTFLAIILLAHQYMINITVEQAKLHSKCRDCILSNIRRQPQGRGTLGNKRRLCVCILVTHIMFLKRIRVS